MTMHKQACRVQEQLFSSEGPSTPEVGRDLAVYLSDLATLQHDLNHVADSQETFQRARQYLETLAAQHPGDTELQFALAGLYRDMGLRRPSPDSLDLLNRARDIFESLVGLSPDENRYRFGLAKLFTAIAMRESQPGRALASQMKANDLWERLADDSPADVEIQRSWVWSLRDSAHFLRFAGRHREATVALNRATGPGGALVADDALAFFASFEVHAMAMLAK